MHLVTVHRSEKCTEKVIIVLSSHLAPSIRLSHQISYFIFLQPRNSAKSQRTKRVLTGTPPLAVAPRHASKPFAKARSQLCWS